jgi:hypothetical protein
MKLTRRGAIGLAAGAAIKPGVSAQLRPTAAASS